MNKRIILIVAFLLFFIEAMTVYWFKLGFDNIVLRETIYLIPSFIGIIAGLVAIRTFGLVSSRSITLLLLTAGISFWFFGEILFNYYAYVLYIDPFPSAADMFYILAYPMFFFGLVNEIHLSQINWKNISKPTLFLFSLVALFLASVIGYFGIYQAYTPDEAFLTNVVAIGYGIGDLILILATMLLLVLVWEFRGSRLSKVWILLFIGFLSTLVADILFAVYTTEYTMQIWFYKSLLDSFWMVGYLFLAFALFEFSFSIQDTYQKAILNAQNKGLQPPQVQPSPPATQAAIEPKPAVPVVPNQVEKKTA